MVKDIKILFAYGPTTNLTLILPKIIEIIKQLNERGITILYPFMMA
ncbi:MAG: hypothetical protein QXX95_07645 [Nitrososphaerales archaeon]